MRKVAKILGWTAAGALAAVILVAAAVLLPPVQRELAHRAVDFLAQRLDAQAGFEDVHMRLWHGVSFDGLYAIDNEGDTLFVADVAVDLKLSREIALRRVKISDGKADIALITSRLRKGNGGGFQLPALDMRRMALKYGDAEVSEMRLTMQNITSLGDSISLEVNDLAGRYDGLFVTAKCPLVTVVGGDAMLDGLTVGSPLSNVFFEKLRLDLRSKTVDAQVLNSTLALAELGRNIELRGLNINVLGSADNLTASGDFRTGDSTHVAASGQWRRQLGNFAVTIDTLATTADDAIAIASELTKKPLSDTLQRVLRRAHTISASGSVSGGAGEFSVGGVVEIALGFGELNISLSGGKLSKGEVFLRDFDLGRLLDVPQLGHATAAATFEESEAEASVSSLSYKGYDYQNIRAHAHFQEHQFVAHATVHDPSLDMLFDWSGSLPLKLAGSEGISHHLQLNLRKADLRALHINTRDSVSQLSLEATGTMAENGLIRVDNIHYINQLGSVNPRAATIHINDERATLATDLSIAPMLVSGLSVSQGSSLRITREHASGKITFDAQADSVAQGTMMATNIRLAGDPNDDFNLVARANARVKKQIVDLGHMSISMHADKVIAAGFALQNPQLNADLRGDTVLLAGDFKVGKREWQISSNEIIARDKRVVINDLRMQSEGQGLSVDGVLGGTNNDIVRLVAQNFDLAPLSDILKIGHTLRGRANGNALITNTLSNPSITAQVDLDSMRIDDVEVPPLLFRSTLEHESVRMLLTERSAANIIAKTGVPVSSTPPQPLVAAIYTPSTHEIRGEMNLKNVELSLLDAHYKGALSSTQGRADVRANIGGRLGRGRGGLIFDGQITAHDYSAKVDYLGVRYAAAPETVLKVRQNVIESDSIAMRDPVGNGARMGMSVNLKSLKNVRWAFDIATDNLLVLNTSQRDNDQFYGHVFASGTVKINGGKQGAQLTVDAVTRDGSQFFMPLSKSDLSEADFLTFADHGALQPRQNPSRARLNVDIALRVEPNTLVELLIDPKTGHRVRGRGNGLLNLHLNPRNEEFSIYGDYRINEGIYLFTLENIIEKPFVITPGGTIQWAGNPLDAQLNISATYNLKTSIGAAMTGSGYDDWRMRIPVECKIHLTEKLSSPVLKFGITAPGATPETQNILSSFLNTEEMTATQFFFLLATGNFYDAESGAGSIGTAAGTTTAFDFLSNQLRTLIASDNFNIGIRYRPQTETTSDEWGLDLSQQLWGERLLLEIEGNYDTRNNQSAAYTENMRNLTGDFNLTGIIDKRGTLRAKIFTRTITRFDENQGLQESGAGLYFTEDFNKVSDIFRRWKRQNRTRKGKK